MSKRNDSGGSDEETVLVRSVGFIVGIGATLLAGTERSAKHVETWTGIGQAQGLGTPTEDTPEDGCGVAAAESVSVMGVI